MHLLELRGVGLLTGEVGCGKTTVCRLVTPTSTPACTASTTSPSPPATDMYKSIAWQLGLLPRHRLPGHPRRDHTPRSGVQTAARPDRRRGAIPAQRVLDDLRLLTNYSMDSEHRLCLLLVGLTELRRRLSMAIHESLNQRLVVRHHLGGLDRDELGLYLPPESRRFRVAVEPPAVEALFQASRASPDQPDRSSPSGRQLRQRTRQPRTPAAPSTSCAPDSTKGLP